MKKIGVFLMLATAIGLMLVGYGGNSEPEPEPVSGILPAFRRVKTAST